MAQEMLATGDFLQKRLYFENIFAQDPVIRDNLQPPLVSYQIILAWKLLGENLWGARLFNILFGLSSILVIYFAAYTLFNSEVLALGSAALLAIMPLSVFFSRNLQPESPAFFFMLLGNLFYLRFIKGLKKYNLLLGGLSFFICWLYSFNFIFGALPFVFCLPFRDMLRDKNNFWKFILALTLTFAVLVSLSLWFKQAGGGIEFVYKRLKPEILSLSYWRQHAAVISWYTKGENFTPVFSILALLGVILAFLKGSGIVNRYIIGWTFCAVIYAVFFSHELYQQNFIQMPFLAMVVISSIYAIEYLAETLKKLLKKDLLVYLLVPAIIAGGFFAYRAIQRMHAVAFLGQDVAGESLKEFTKPKDRVFLFTYSQGYAISRYAQRYVGWTQNVDEFQKKQKEFDIRYICFYPAEFAREMKNNNPELFSYIQNHYHAKEVGFTDEPNRLFYIILERGRGSDPKAFLESFAGEKRLRTIYKVSGSYIFFYSIRPPAEPKQS
jgi:4-amino-4-deoxy-L-arabinose transferase-like glycosyltransferase